MTEVESGATSSVPSMGQLVRDETDQTSVPSVYCNGFEFAISLSDVCVVTHLNGKREQRLHMSFTTAKALMLGMQQLVAHIEQASGHEIPTMDQMNAAFTAVQAGQLPAARE